MVDQKFMLETKTDFSIEKNICVITWKIVEAATAGAMY